MTSALLVILKAVNVLESIIEDKFRTFLIFEFKKLQIGELLLSFPISKVCAEHKSLT